MWASFRVVRVMMRRITGKPADWRSEGEENMVLAMADNR